MKSALSRWRSCRQRSSRQGRTKKSTAHLARFSVVLVGGNRRTIPGIHRVSSHLVHHGGLRLADKAESESSFPDQFCCTERSIDPARAIQHRETRSRCVEFQTYMARWL